MGATEIIRQIQETFRRNADRVFLIETPIDREFTYGEFYSAALRSAGMLRSRGVRRGDRVALILANSSEFAALYFGCLFLGAVAVPVNQALHPDEVRFIVERSGAKLLLFSLCTRPLVTAAASGLSCPQVRVMLAQEKVFHPEDDEVWSLDEPAGELPEPFAGMADDDLLIVLFTSGTTSAPKGVAHRIRSQFGNAIAFNAEMDFGPDHRFLHVWPMAYSSGFLNTLLSPFMAGGSVVLACAFTAQTVLTFWKPVVEHSANTLWLSPTMMASLLRIDRDEAGIDYCRRAIRSVCCGTAPLPLRLKKDFEAKYGVEVFESYGLSELLIVTGNSPRHPRRENSVGRALPGVEISIAQDEEILVRTPFAMAGYFDPETKQPAPIEAGGWFPTGDLGHVDDEGNLLVTGRKKDLIIRGGLNISPRAVRDVLLEHPAIEDAAVVGTPHDFYGEEVVAALRMKPDRSLAEEQSSILKLCRSRLNQASVPTRLVEVAQFPVGSTGKVLIRELRTLLQQDAAAAPASRAAG